LYFISFKIILAIKCKKKQKIWREINNITPRGERRKIKSYPQADKIQKKLSTGIWTSLFNGG